MLSKGLRKGGKVERLFDAVWTPLLLLRQIYRDLRQADHFTIRPIKRVISCHKSYQGFLASLMRRHRNICINDSIKGEEID